MAESILPDMADTPGLTGASARAILHCYTGPLGVADDALAAGLSFSVNPAMMASAKGRTPLARLPHDRVVLETDGPYTRRPGRPCEPADLARLVEDLARLWQTIPTQVHASICENQRRLTDPGSAPGAAARTG
jgi:TatD DNase family protein